MRSTCAVYMTLFEYLTPYYFSLLTISTNLTSILVHFLLRTKKKIVLDAFDLIPNFKLFAFASCVCVSVCDIYVIYGKFNALTQHSISGCDHLKIVFKTKSEKKQKYSFRVAQLEPVGLSGDYDRPKHCMRQFYQQFRFCSMSFVREIRLNLTKVKNKLKQTMNREYAAA